MNKPTKSPPIHPLCHLYRLAISQESLVNIQENPGFAGRSEFPGIDTIQAFPNTLAVYMIEQARLLDLESQRHLESGSPVLARKLARRLGSPV